MRIWDNSRETMTRTMTTELSILTTTLYLLSATAAWIAFFKNKPSLNWLVSLSTLGALSGHGWLLHHFIDLGPGQDLHLVNIIGLLCWLIALWIAGLSFRYATRPLATIWYPLTAFSVWLPLLPYDEVVFFTSAHPSLLAHILLSLLGLSLLGVAAIQALFIGWQLHRLHHRAPLWLQMPSLESMENCLFRLLWSGFFVMTLGLGVGFVFLGELFQPQYLTKTLLSILAWLVIACLLWGHYRYGWRGRLAVKSTLVGVSVLLIAYLSSKGWTLTP